MTRTLKSALSEVRLLQTIKMTVPVPCRIEYTARHRGDGNNGLRVRFGNSWNLIWAKIHDFELNPGKSQSRTTEIVSDTTGSDDDKQDVRWRLSRAVLTAAIDWELTYTVTRIKDETDVTNQCQATVTNDEE